ncbi:MAG: PIG-L family deacetylase [Cyanobacteria bacterium]|nr:PIG-L family deacetylase [Cyanobacteriota bacterium]
MNIAVVVAHPDDAEYMVGGTILRYSNLGHKVTIVLCTNGNTGHPKFNKEKITKIRLKEAIEGAEILGAKVLSLGYDDEFMPDCKESRLNILNALREINPVIVFTHHPNDYSNADHRVVSNIVIDVSYLQMVKKIKTSFKETNDYAQLYFMDIPAGVGFEPTDYVNITEVFELKIKALSKHKSQQVYMTSLGAGKYFSKNVEIQSAFRGLQFQCEYAEAFINMNKYPRAMNKKLLPQYL